MHQLDAEAELLGHVALAAEQHRQPQQVVRGVTGHHLRDPAHAGQLVALVWVLATAAAYLAAGLVGFRVLERAGRARGALGAY